MPIAAELKTKANEPTVKLVQKVRLDFSGEANARCVLNVRSTA
jgi:hypothetical protein